jgi:glutamine amidotransferase
VTSVALVDYGSGNVHSVAKALRHVGAEVVLTADPRRIADADRLVLPGVGAFADCASGVRERGLVEPLRAYAASGRPFLGICVGMQLLFGESEEFGRHAGLGLIPGRVRAILPTPGIKVPHIGWNSIYPPQDRGWSGTPLHGLQPGAMVYFVHSYSADPADAADWLAVAHYGGYRISAAVRRGNVWGCQFHPEKSGELGLGVLRRWLES